ncbi:basic helix-loop-helix (bHLH) DNA-bindingsuperfamily protein [Striga asiatica]|uniref:Basic helix-loop-helix (BHLH) DNA-bindingsuperfamily protein n=1 Tax=Striga asiatica TaxID=4170 RepID=A0A5A7PVR1_STRAF|nr:basic helix-loop-helix (bHLH) DNA-bindingsuperfamily protein [Striga asiatica]
MAEKKNLAPTEKKEKPHEEGLLEKRIVNSNSNRLYSGKISIEHQHHRGNVPQPLSQLRVPANCCSSTSLLRPYGSTSDSTRFLSSQSSVTREFSVRSLHEIQYLNTNRLMGQKKSSAEDKSMKVCNKKEVSKIIEQNCSKSTTTTVTISKNSKMPYTNAKENSKTSDNTKLDYIHVHARRSQATDSHSLAERV